VTPTPQLPQAYVPPVVRGVPERDTDSRSYSRHAQYPRSQSQTSLPYGRDASQPLPQPLFTSEDRGFPYASVPPPPLPQTSFVSQPATFATRPSSHSGPMPLTLMTSFPQTSATFNTSSRPSSSASQPFFPSASTPQSQNSSHR
jgi:hypothetical protein